MNQPDQPGQEKLTRRRLVRAGATAIPIVLTLHARPALAQDGDASGNVSGLPGYGKAGKWLRGADGKWHWDGFIDPNTGDWNGKGESPDMPPADEPQGGRPETPPGQSHAADPHSEASPSP